MISKAGEAWQTFYKNKAKSNYLRWPDEVMVKIIFGNYLKNRIELTSQSKILDVGCGFGNNLLPFLVMGYECFGTEVTPDIARQTQQILNKCGFQASVKQGKNQNLPFENDFFDLLLSINAIHYEKTEDDILHTLQEYNRVLKRGGHIFLITVGPEHTIQKRAKIIGPHRYLIQNYDFRNGEQLFFFNSLKYLDHCLSQLFIEIEVGRVTEKLMAHPMDSLIGVCKSKK